MRKYVAVALLTLSILLLPAFPALAVSNNYGQHYPQGKASVDYLYGPEGTWKFMSNVEYIWNYYPQYATPNHPYDRNALIGYANGTHMTTARDADGHLLLDLNHDGELDVFGGSYAFEEHNGKGVNGQTIGAPFSNFWYDDNWLARYMAIAYGRPHPYGLSAYDDFNRWAILDADGSRWVLYNSDFYDTLALDGLYYLSVGDAYDATLNWDRMLEKSLYYYDGANQRYVYPDITSNYHLGLFKILTDKLIDSGALAPYKQNQLLQHSVSLRSDIISNQETNGSSLLGWRTGIGDANSLINTETTAVNTLALGVNCKYVFEAGRSPLFMNDNNYFLRPHNALSAVNGLSAPGHMTYGPYWNFAPGSYQAEFLLRVPSPSGQVATLDVYDANTGTFLAQRAVFASDLLTGNQWTRITLNFTVTNPSNSLEFRTWWHGGPNMDVAYIRVR
jgi:hypothetical protein